MSLVDTLRDKYRRRSREVSRLLEERDLEGIAAVRNGSGRRWRSS